VKISTPEYKFDDDDDDIMCLIFLVVTFRKTFEKSDSAETAEISPSQETVGTLETAETGETVVETSRFRKSLMCISRKDSQHSEDDHSVYQNPNFPYYFREA